VLDRLEVAEALDTAPMTSSSKDGGSSARLTQA
jgi:hypothetical protein